MSGSESQKQVYLNHPFGLFLEQVGYSRIAGSLLNKLGQCWNGRQYYLNKSKYFDFVYVYNMARLKMLVMLR